MSSADGFFLRATCFAGSPTFLGGSCSGQQGGVNNTLVCARPPCGKSPMKDKKGLQNIADSDFNIEMQVRNLLQALSSFIRGNRLRCPSRSDADGGALEEMRRGCRKRGDAEVYTCSSHLKTNDDIAIVLPVMLVMFRVFFVLKQTERQLLHSKGRGGTER